MTTRRALVPLTSLVLALPLALCPRAALAYCFATTCDPEETICREDRQTKCPLDGEALRWDSGCVAFSVQAEAASAVGIGYDDAVASLARALETWATADCGGGRTPSLRYEMSQPVQCRAPEYNDDRSNANVLIFHERSWPYTGGPDALGYTRLHFDPEEQVGALWDADININAFSERLAVGEPGADEVDLDSLITHEVGHALGLTHSLEAEATMRAGYVKGSTELRSLSTDDIAGICALYPPGRDASSRSCEPRRGFSPLCGSEQPEPEPSARPDPSNESCTIAAITRSDHGPLLWLLACFGAASRAKFAWKSRRRRAGGPRRKILSSLPQWVRSRAVGF